MLSVPDQVARLGEMLGRTIETIDVPLNVARKRMLASGTDSAFVDAVSKGTAIIRAGGNEILTDDVERVLGRAPTAFEAWARDHRDAFAN